MISASQVPNEFMCPITADIMDEPVSLADGRSYERTAIQRWLQSSNRSPMTGQELPHTNMVPNVNLKALIKDWRDSHVVTAATREEETCLHAVSCGEFAALRAQFQGAVHDVQHHLVVERVQKIYNDDARRRFMHKRQELEALRRHCPVVLKYHGTSQAAAAAIARRGFELPEADADGSFPGRCAHGSDLMFGQAVYVASEMEKAVFFALADDDSGALVLCQCALGNVHQARAPRYGLTQFQLLLDGFDSVQDLTGCHEEEFALYSPDQILATHIVHFRRVLLGLDPPWTARTAFGSNGLSRSNGSSGSTDPVRI